MKAKTKKATKKTPTKKRTRVKGPPVPKMIAPAQFGWWAVVGDPRVELFVSPVAVWALQEHGVVGMVDDGGLTSAEAEDDFITYMFAPLDDVNDVIAQAEDDLNVEYDDDGEEDDVEED